MKKFVIVLVLCLVTIVVASCSPQSFGQASPSAPSNAADNGAASDHTPTLSGTWRGRMSDQSSQLDFVLTLNVDGSGYLKGSAGPAGGSASFPVADYPISYRQDGAVLRLFNEEKRAFSLSPQLVYSNDKDYGMPYTLEGNTMTLEIGAGSPLVLRK